MHFWRIVFSVFAATSLMLGEQPGREKVAEGVYVKLINNASVAGSEQSWTLWRFADGSFELENQVTVRDENEAAELLAAIGSKHLSPALKADLEKRSRQTHFNLHLRSDHRADVLTVRGERLSDAKKLELAFCEIKAGQASCKGHRGKARYKLAGEEELLYSFPFPLLFRPMLLGMNSSPGQAVKKKVVFMTLGEDGPRLEQASLTIEYHGEDALALGQQSFKLGKYTITIRAPNQPLDITLWAARNGLIMAMEEARFSGERMGLVKFKKYSEF